jgi:hypothetical protein
MGSLPASVSATTAFRCDGIPPRSPGIDQRSLPPKVSKRREIYVPDLHIDGIK